MINAVGNKDTAVIAINNHYVNFACPVCRTINHSMVIEASEQERQNIRETINTIAKRMMDKKIIKINKLQKRS
jgi:phage FluMu protein Com